MKHIKLLDSRESAENGNNLQGNCSTPMPTSASLGLTPTAAPLQPVKPRQCLVISDWSLFEVVGSRVWLEGLYIRMVTSRGGAAYPIGELIPIGDKPGLITPQVWMTNVTLQGNGGAQQECEWCGLRATEASVYAEGVLLSGFCVCAFTKFF